jgi:hypothetical protein
VELLVKQVELATAVQTILVLVVEELSIMLLLALAVQALSM